MVQIRTSHHIEFSPALRREVRDHLRSGGILIHPADTCYGIAGRADLTDMPARISKLKGVRSADKRFSLAVADIAMAQRIVEIAPHHVQQLRHLTPERLSFIFPGKEEESSAIRIPKLRWFRRVIQSLGVPVITTSANTTGNPPLYTIQEIIETFSTTQEDLLILDGGTIPKCLPSTLLDMRTSPPTILRQGSYVRKNTTHTPTRMCICTRERRPKQALLALSIQQGKLQIGSQGHGRHCYLLPDPTRIERCLRSPKNPIKHHLHYTCTENDITAILSACTLFSS